MSPKYSSHQTKTFTATFPARGMAPQIVVTGIIASGPERAIAVARDAILQAAAATPTIS